MSNPYDAWRMDNGHTLIADMNGIHQVDQDGNTVWNASAGQALRVCYY